jgi:hypothetical protein
MLTCLPPSPTSHAHTDSPVVSLNTFGDDCGAGGATSCDGEDSVDTFYPLSLNPDLPFATQQRIHSMRTSTHDLQILPTLGRGFSSASSPRSRYILGCLEKRLNPRASLLIRKSLSGELNLKHMGIGDSMAIELTSALTELPFLHTVDISENSLGDEGLVAMFNAFSCMPGLTALNSQTMRSNQVLLKP